MNFHTLKMVSGKILIYQQKRILDLLLFIIPFKMLLLVILFVVIKLLAQVNICICFINKTMKILHDSFMQTNCEFDLQGNQNIFILKASDLLPVNDISRIFSNSWNPLASVILHFNILQENRWMRKLKLISNL